MWAITIILSDLKSEPDQLNISAYIYVQNQLYKSKKKVWVLPTQGQSQKSVTPKLPGWADNGHPGVIS